MIEIDKIYHYTSIEAFQGIIKNDELWLSERNCMNDIFDENYIKNIVKKILNPNNSPLFKGSLFDEDFISDLPQYVFSTSIQKDVAHQWLNYGMNNPICIAFDKNKLVEYFSKFSKQDYIVGKHYYENHFFSSEVIYNKDEVTNKAEQFVSLYRDEWYKELENVTSPRSPEFFSAFLDFHNFYSCVKQPNFYAENEYRFLIYTKRKPEFRTRGDRLISYLKVHIEREKLPILEIIVSPFTSDGTYNNTIRKFLYDNEYRDTIVSPSELHLRKTHNN